MGLSTSVLFFRYPRIANSDSMISLLLFSMPLFQVFKLIFYIFLFCHSSPSYNNYLYNYIVSQEYIPVNQLCHTIIVFEIILKKISPFSLVSGVILLYKQRLKHSRHAVAFHIQALTLGFPIVFVRTNIKHCIATYDSIWITLILMILLKLIKRCQSLCFRFCELLSVYSSTPPFCPS